MRRNAPVEPRLTRDRAHRGTIGAWHPFTSTSTAAAGSPPPSSCCETDTRRTASPRRCGRARSSGYVKGTMDARSSRPRRCRLTVSGADCAGSAGSASTASGHPPLRNSRSLWMPTLAPSGRRATRRGVFERSLTPRQFNGVRSARREHERSRAWSVACGMSRLTVNRSLPSRLPSRRSTEGRSHSPNGNVSFHPIRIRACFELWAGRARAAANRSSDTFSWSSGSASLSKSRSAGCGSTSSSVPPWSWRSTAASSTMARKRSSETVDAMPRSALSDIE
jgi:hypothetical protein